jgi:hypothetical protein
MQEALDTSLAAVRLKGPSSKITFIDKDVMKH